MGEIEEAKLFQQRGNTLLQRLLTDPQLSENKKRKLSLKLTIFAQLTVDFTIASGDINQAFILAEEGKNTCLRWLLGEWQVPELIYNEIQSFLPEQTAIIYWHLSPLSLTTFLLLPGETAPILLSLAKSNLSHDLAANQSASLANLQKWEKWLRNWNEEYEEYTSPKQQKQNPQVLEKKEFPWRKNIKEKLVRLQKIFNIAEIENYLKKHEIKNLILIPHRDLHRLPLHFCFPKYTCSYLPSCQMGLRNLNFNNQNNTTKDLLLVENPKSTPSITKKPLLPLIYAEVEAAVIKQMFDRDTNNYTYLEDDRNQNRITWDTLKEILSTPHRIFHFNGHGAYDSDNPTLCFSVFSHCST